MRQHPRHSWIAGLIAIAFVLAVAPVAALATDGAAGAPGAGAGSPAIAAPSADSSTGAPIASTETGDDNASTSATGDSGTRTAGETDGKSAGVDEVASAGATESKGEPESVSDSAHALAPMANEVAPLATETPAARSDQFTSSNHHQIVLVVRFKDGEKNQDGSPREVLNENLLSGTVRWSWLLDTLRKDYDSLQPMSLRGYLDHISSGKYKLSTEAPQDDRGSRVRYIELPYERSDARYAAETGHINICLDAIKAFNDAYPNYNTSGFNTSADRYLDNLMLVIDVGKEPPQTRFDPLWPKKEQLSNSVQVTRIGTEATVNTFTVIPTSAAEGICTITHEYIHTLGVRDLYRADDTGKPVGTMWDIMAGSSYNTMPWPLAQTLVDIGFTSPIQEAKPQTQEVTLYSHESDSGPQAMIFKTPRSSSEYFVAEFRKQGGVGAGEMDKKIPGTGLLIYRVNPKYRTSGNLEAKSDSGASEDYIYVFRPGETDASAASGDLSNAQRNMTSGHTTFGTANFSDGPSQQTIFYSSGENSGLVMEVKSMTSDSITFEVTYPDYEQSGIWDDALDSQMQSTLPKTEVSGISAATDGTSVYVASQIGYSTNSRLQVSKYSQGHWTSLGDAATGFYNPQLIWHNGSLYAIGATYGSSPAVVLRRHTGSSWVEVARISRMSTFVSACSIDGSLYIVTDDSSGEGSSHKSPKLHKLVDSTFQQVGSDLPVSNIQNPTVTRVGSNPAVVCGDSASKETVLCTYMGGAWRKTTLASGEAQITDAAFDGTNTYLLYRQQGAQVSIATISPTNAVVKTTTLVSPDCTPLYAAIVVAGGNALVTVVDGASTSIHCFSSKLTDLSAWSELGSSVAAKSSNMDSVVVGDRIYCATYESTGGSSLKQYSLPSSGSSPEQPSKFASAITLANPGTKYLGDDPFTLNVTKTPSKAGLKFSSSDSANVAVDSAGKVSIKGVPKSGSVTITAKFAGDASYQPATSSVTFAVKRATTEMGVTYQAHVQNVGWQRDWQSNGGVAGTSGKGLRVEGLNLKLTGAKWGGKVHASAHVQNIGWQRETSAASGKTLFMGTSGRALRVEAIKLWLDGAVAKHYDIWYRVHVQNLGWTGWTRNGQEAGTSGCAYRLEAIQVKLVGKGGAAPGTLRPLVQYRTHVQNVGWQPYRFDGAMSGTSGRALRLEGINVALTNLPYAGGIRYRTHVQNIGWEGAWRRDGAMSGTSGRALRLEAIQVELTGELASHYEVWYRVHCQNLGWMGWARNGASAGSAGFGYRLEGIEIRLLPKGQTLSSKAPAFRQR